MYFNLKALNEEYGILQLDITKALGVAKNTYVKWRDKCDVPANNYYLLHMKYPKYVPLPDDFEDYTPFIIGINMKIYGKTQTDVGNAIGKDQEAVNKIFKRNDYLYDYKEQLDLLFPTICIPCVRNGKGKYVDVRKNDRLKNLDQKDIM